MISAAKKTNFDIKFRGITRSEGEKEVLKEMDFIYLKFITHVTNKRMLQLYYKHSGRRDRNKDGQGGRDVKMRMEC